MKTISTALLILTFSIAVYAQDQTTSLEPGKSIEQTINGGEKHTYNLTLAPGSSGLVEVEQKSMNVGVTILSTDGQKLRVADQTGIGFYEGRSLLAGDAATYHIEVFANDKPGTAGAYAIKLKETRPATDQDK